MQAIKPAHVLIRVKPGWIRVCRAVWPMQDSRDQNHYSMHCAAKQNHGGLAEWAASAASKAIMTDYYLPQGDAVAHTVESCAVPTAYLWVYVNFIK